MTGRLALITLVRERFVRREVQFQLKGKASEQELVVKEHYGLGNFVDDEKMRESPRRWLERKGFDFLFRRVARVGWQIEGRENLVGLPEGEAIFIYGGKRSCLDALAIKMLVPTQFDKEKLLTVNQFQDEAAEALEQEAWIVPVKVEGTGQIFPKGGEGIITFGNPLAFVRDSDTEPSTEEILAASAFLRERVEGLNQSILGKESKLMELP